ncbi:transposase [Streptomyces sviceus]|uniref:transposase n=1 Tax=Streptomyces sviceus TaxID=285530 RepID=UPI0036F0748D
MSPAFGQAAASASNRQGGSGQASQALIPLMRGIPPIRSRYGPRRRRPAKLHADKGYDLDHLRNWLRRRQIVPRIARRGVESSSRLGRHRWVVEGTMSWLNGCRRLRLLRMAEMRKTHRRCRDERGVVGDSAGVGMALCG